MDEVILMSEAIVDDRPDNRTEFRSNATVARATACPSSRPEFALPQASRCDACTASRCWIREKPGAGACPLAGLDAKVRPIKAGRHIVFQGDVIGHVLTLAEGMAVVYRLFEDGRRQVLRFAFPGDILAFPGWTSAMVEYTVEALTAASVCCIPLESLAAAFSRSPTVALSLTARLARELDASWALLAALGRQSARERLAMLLLTLHRKAHASEPALSRSSRLPLNLVLLADATGLTPVHVCRTLKSMRLDGLLEWNKGHLSILAPDRLARIAQLDPVGGPVSREEPSRARMAG
jgi:CRP-like cAMP-binding protein